MIRYGKNVGRLNRALVLAALLLACAFSAISQIRQSSDLPYKMDVQDLITRRQQVLLRNHADESGKVREDLWYRGVEQAKKMGIASQQPGPSSLGTQWTQIGPAPVLKNSDAVLSYSGMVTDIAIYNPSSISRAQEIIYIATDNGGIWKSTDGGNSWTPKTDSMVSLSTGAVAIDPGSNLSALPTIYAGTGDNFSNGFRKAVGLYKSSNGGDNWDVINPGDMFTGIGINRIVIPAPNVLLVGTGAGLFRSKDGGLHFGNNAPGFDNSQAFFPGSFISDLKRDTASASTVYAAVQGQGIFRSTDSGATFPSLGNLFSNAGAPAAAYFNIHFDQSTQPDNRTIYATVEFADCQTLGLFKSDDGGGSWNQPGASGLSGFQCGYDDVVRVDPQDQNQLYVGLISLFRSTNGGTGFSDVRGPGHPDIHAIAFSPFVLSDFFHTTPVYVGSDGGIATSADGGDSFKNINAGLATALFRQIDIGRGSDASNAFTYGGMQDNAVAVSRAGFPPLEWHQNTGDLDGFGIAVDPSNPMNAYTSLNGGVNRTLDGGTTWQYFGVNNAFAFAVDPNDGTIVYAVSDNGTNTFAPGPQLFRSQDSGKSFDPIPIKTFPAAIQAIATVAADSNILWVGLSDGTVQRTANALAGVTALWVPLTMTGAPSLPVGGLAVDPSNTTRAIVVYQGFTSPNPTGLTRHVFLTADSGATWTDISGTVGGDPAKNLPDLPLHSVAIYRGTSPSTIVVGSDAAVLRTVNNGATWEVLGAGLPTVDCVSLALDDSGVHATGRAEPILRVGTYGRSAFELTLPAESADVNGDGKVDCADLAVIRVPFGKMAGDPGFDARADLNGDGIIDILDLAFAAQALPGGVSCPQLLVVPRSLTNAEGNDSDDFTLSAPVPSVRFQQVYASSEFSSNGVLNITAVSFRPDQNRGASFTATLPHVQLRLSTTSVTSDDIDATIVCPPPPFISCRFADNVGSDETVVFDGSLILSSMNTGRAGGPKDSDITILFTTPFRYDPSKGNLLLDLRNYTTVGTTFLDAQNAPNDAILHVDAPGVDSLAGNWFTSGLVTTFEFH